MTDSPGSRGNGPPRRTDRRLWQEEEAPLSPLGRAFLAYWHAKCPPGGGFPARADIAPDEMVRLLPSLFLVDVLPEAAGGCDRSGARRVGKSVSVRLYLGVCRFIKKKKIT